MTILSKEGLSVIMSCVLTLSACVLVLTTTTAASASEEEEEKTTSGIFAEDKGPIIYHKGDTEVVIDMPTRIGEASNFSEMILLLRTASAETTITIYNSGYGGYVQTASRIISAIKASNANVVLIVDGPAYSAHASIACAAPTLMMERSSFLMFHSFQGKDGPIEWEDMSEGDRYLVTYWFEDLCSGLLTLTQARSMVHDLTEVYITPEFIERHLLEPTSNEEEEL